MVSDQNEIALPNGLPPEEEDTIDSDSDKESEVNSLTLRRNRPIHQTTRKQPSRKSKQPINYKGMFALVNEKAEVNQETISDIFKADCVFLSTLELQGDGFRQNSSVRALEQHV